MALVSKIKNKGQLTIPKEIMERMNLAIGDMLEFHVKGETITLKPVSVQVIPKDEKWLWTAEMQDVIKKADADFKAGKLKAYTDIDEMFKDMGIDV